MFDIKLVKLSSLTCRGGMGLDKVWFPLFWIVLDCFHWLCLEFTSSSLSLSLSVKESARAPARSSVKHVASLVMFAAALPPQIMSVNVIQGRM